jgi:hypothetical protein
MRKTSLSDVLWNITYPFWRIKDAIHDYKLRHLKLGKVKQHKKDSYTDFEIVNISWNIHWMTDLYLAVIIRDYLRFFIKNTPAIGNTVFEGDYSKMHNMTDEETAMYSEKWHDLVNNTADEFDELAKLAWRENVDDWQAYRKKEKELIKNAFADLAYIFDELNW